MAVKLTISHEFSGMGDYWGGNGRRWDNDAGCLFAFYGAQTTLRECVDQWVDDFWQGGDFDNSHLDSDPWTEVTEGDVRAAILDSLTDQGRADYESGALAECAAEYAAINGLDGSFVVGEEVLIDGVSSSEDGTVTGTITRISDTSVIIDVDGKTYRRDHDDVYPLNDDDDCMESPIWVLLLEGEQCEECHTVDTHYVDALCEGCSKKHYPNHFDNDGDFIG